MAFGGLEDLQGTAELLFFPSIWKDCHSIVEQDKVYIVKGKVRFDRGDRARIIVDSITDNLSLAKPMLSEGPLPEPTQMYDPESDVELPLNEPLDISYAALSEENELESGKFMPSPPPNIEPSEGGWLPMRDETLANDQGQISPIVDISDRESVVTSENTTLLANGEPQSIDKNPSPANLLLSQLSLSSNDPLGRTIVVDVEPTDPVV